ncbi:MAG: 50S ribosomal protein L21 [Spiroplasma poulsonii]|uniref:Large ribosomal subunit protein bL21 n=1 Tax=Spiroplasma poulsonii TaxID=2138 RepID=A0A2P6FBT8_9MOLU|nr:50S ribosomal protein L21 [Spiroplasma poulsonii]MBH8622544.1 50S ribosomal protein L21 [Spiroplasma sp. hyd1]MBW1241672.1 50S ribosomal protein L21 [Spiroplasma poulsonii]MBW3058333.1 50S ribosomal protein L21 [Spiroplasma poulsonii]PQM30921.1 50S ribosomal protein L21 [Spiroplasma poulsonii]
MFAIIKTGGKQLRVSQGDEIFVEMLNGNEGEKVNFTEVLMVDGKVGTPFLKGASVTGTILKQGKQKKIVVFHYKPKKTQHKKYGHRQPYTKIKIDQILLSGTAKPAVAAETKPAAVAKPATSAEPKPVVKPVVSKPAPAAKPATVKSTTAAKPAAKTSTTTSAKKPVTKTEKNDK